MYCAFVGDVVFVVFSDVLFASWAVVDVGYLVDEKCLLIYDKIVFCLLFL